MTEAWRAPLGSPKIRAVAQRKAKRGAKKKAKSAAKPAGSGRSKARAKPKAQRRARVPSAVRSASVLLAFVEESVERGSVQKVSMRAVAARADCTLAQIYRIFGSRVELIRAAVVWTLGPHNIDLARSRDASQSAHDRLWELGEAVADRGLGDRAIFNALVVSELRADPDLASFVHSAVQGSAGIVANILREGVESGEFHADLDCDYVAWRFVSLNTFRIHAYLLGVKQLEALDYERRTFEALLDEICIDPPKRKPRPNAEGARPARPVRRGKRS